MNAESTLKVITALAEGLDPATGAGLPGGNVTQRPEVIRALFHAAAILEHVARRERRLQRARLRLPRNTGKEWSHEDDRTLLGRFKTGASVADIAFIHGRTERAIRARLEKLGQMPPEPGAASSPASRPLPS